MDDVLADLSLNHPPDSQDGLLELSIGTDAIQTDVLEQSGDISLSTDNVMTMLMIHLSMRLRQIA